MHTPKMSVRVCPDLGLLRDGWTDFAEIWQRHAKRVKKGFPQKIMKKKHFKKMVFFFWYFGEKIIFCVLRELV
jgi:hypothetical protein